MDYTTDIPAKNCVNSSFQTFFYKFRQYTPAAAVFKTVLILASSRKTDLLSNTENLRKFKQLEFRKKAAQPVLQNAKKIKKSPLYHDIRCCYTIFS